MFQCASDYQPNVLHDKRLAEIIESSGFNGIHSSFERSVGGQQDYRNIRFLFAHGGQ